MTTITATATRNAAAADMRHNAYMMMSDVVDALPVLASESVARYVFTVDSAASLVAFPMSLPASCNALYGVLEEVAGGIANALTVGDTVEAYTMGVALADTMYRALALQWAKAVAAAAAAAAA
jgi:hypothetical protein